jgi:3-oxoadipate enol-lactonase
MGSAIGQWLGIHAPQRLHKLILASTATKFGAADVWNARIELVSREGLAPVIPGTLDRWFTPDFHQSHPEVIARTRAQLQDTSVQGYTACCAAVRDTDFRSTVASIHVPTLVVVGTLDPVTPPAEAQSIAAQIPAAQLVELPAAHLCSVQAATQFNAALLSFLAD